jgi:hypothetical protein
VIKIYKPGSWVMIGDDIPATVSRVSISPNDTIAYEVVWWDGRDCTEKWVHAHEVNPHPKTETSSVGFHQEIK